MKMNTQLNIDLMHLQALELLEAGNTKQGMELLLRVLEQRPKDPQVLITVGNALNDMGRSQEAIVILRSAVNQLPGQALPLISLGAALLRNGEAAAAEGFLERALALDPKEYTTMTNLAACLIKLSKTPERAEQLLHQAARLSPDTKTSQHIYFNLGRALQQQGQLTKAGQAWNHAIQLSPQSDIARAIRDRYPHLNSNWKN